MECDDGQLFLASFHEDVVLVDGHDALEEALHVLVVVEEDVGPLGDLFELGGLAFGHRICWEYYGIYEGGGIVKIGYYR